METKSNQATNEALRHERGEANPTPDETALACMRIPSRLAVSGAGTAVCNGVYRWAGSISGKPFWLHEDGSERAVWYFQTVCARARAGLVQS